MKRNDDVKRIGKTSTSIRRSSVGFRAGYHPSPHTLDRLRVNERTPSKSARNYIDPQTGKVYSKRAVQEARSGYLHIETKRDLRSQGLEVAIRKANEMGLAIPTLARRYAAHHDLTLEDALNSSRFWHRVGDAAEYLHAKEETFGAAPLSGGRDEGSIMESEARIMWDGGEDEDHWEYDIPWDDVTDFFEEFDSDWLDDLLDDFGMENEVELGFYH